MEIPFSKETLDQWIVIEALLLLGGLWRSFLFLSNYFASTNYNAAKLDVFAPLATVTIAFYLARGLRRRLFAPNALEINQGGLWLNKGFWGRSYNWSNISRIALCKKIISAGTLERMHFELQVIQSEQIVCRLLITDTIFDLSDLKRTLSNYTIFEYKDIS